MRVWSCVVGDVCNPCSSGSVCLRVCISVCEGLRGWAGGSDRVSVCQTLRRSACVSGLLTLAPADFALNASEFCFRKVLVASGPHPLGHRLPLRPRQGPLQSQWCFLPLGWDGPEPGPFQPSHAVPSGPVECVHGMVARTAECLCRHQGSGSGWGRGHRSISSKSQMSVRGSGLRLRSEVHSWQRAGVSLWLGLGQEAHTDWGQGSSVAVAEGQSAAGVRGPSVLT